MDFKVLITRTEQRAKKLIGLLEEKGITARAIPVTRTVYLDETMNLPDLTLFDFLAFTSMNAAIAFARKAENLELPESLKIASVGKATSEFLKNKLGKPEILPAESNAVSLAGAILKAKPSARVFWPCGDIAMENFPREIENGGGTIENWLCYKTEIADKKATIDNLSQYAPWDLAMFAAPSAVRAFSEIWEDKDTFISLAIGKTTLQALNQNGFGKIILSAGVEAEFCADTINKIADEKRKVGRE